MSQWATSRTRTYTCLVLCVLVTGTLYGCAGSVLRASPGFTADDRLAPYVPPSVSPKTPPTMPPQVRVGPGTRPSVSQVSPHSALPKDDGLYYLPYRAGKSYRVVQAGPGPFSHSGTQKYAVDFSMPVGTPILASRAGVVIAVKEDSTIRGTSPKYGKHGNYVRIRHVDGTEALYLHLKVNGARVSVGQRVARGQHIADSGHTGQSAMPHLHIQIDRRDARGRRSSIPVRFVEIGGNGVPGFLGSYKSKNRQQ